MIRPFLQWVGKLSVPVIFSASLFVSSAYTAAPYSQLDTQRDLYQKAQTLLDNKDLQAVKKIRPALDNYPLVPYIDYRSFLIDLKNKTPAQVRAFIHKYHTLPFSGRISAPYLDSLYKQKNWRAIIAFQPHAPRGESYQCIYYRALYETGHQEKAFQGAKLLWHSSQGIADECDGLFAVWKNAGRLSDTYVLQRMLLAFEANNGKLMRYLMKLPQSPKGQRQAQEMMSLYAHPQRVLQFAKAHPQTEFYQSQIQYAYEKQVNKNSLAAQSLFTKLMRVQKFDKLRMHQMAQYAAFVLLGTDSKKLAQWRDGIIRQYPRSDLTEIRIRLALREADWSGVKKWIQLLDKSERESLRWQYWLARSDIKLGNQSAGKERMHTLLGERNFYSIAAAQQLGVKVQYTQKHLYFDDSTLEKYHLPLARISELLDQDKFVAAKNEWRWLVQRVKQTDKEMLAVYAEQRGWAHFAVVASIGARMWDNIEVRFPVAYRWWFDFYGRKYSIDPLTLMALARQESALDPTAHSSVGARGLMQVMPRTAKHTARQYKLSYKNVSDLYAIDKNIAIGSSYLHKLMKSYDNNRVLAFAAYNAGPGRLSEWRKRSDGQLDVYAFIESIPFRETRGYVKNILMFENYYRDILKLDGAFLKQNELNAMY